MSCYIENRLPYEFRIILHGGLTEFSIKERLWPATLDLAKECGWKPMGTIPPETEHAGAWNGAYIEPWEQRVCRNDARNIAEALKRALEYLPNEEDWEDRYPEMEYPYFSFAGRRAKQTLREFIQFCRQALDGFCITGPIRVRRHSDSEANL